MYRKVMGVLVFLRCFMLKYLSCLRGENISETGAKGSRQEAFLTARQLRFSAVPAMFSTTRVLPGWSVILYSFCPSGRVVIAAALPAP